MKNFTTISRVICVMLMMVAPLALAAQSVILSNVQEGDLYYDIYSNGEAVVVNNDSYASLTSVSVPQVLTGIGGYTVTEVAKSAFSNCTKLEYVSLPMSVTTIGTGAFLNCGSLTSIEFSAVTTIGEIAFSGCKKLASITLPATVTSIGANAFYNCAGLGTIYCQGLVPPSTGGWSSSFMDSHYTGTTLYIHEAAAQAYKDATPDWHYFEKVKYYEQVNAVDAVEGDAVAAPTAIYTLDGAEVKADVESLKPGVYVIRQGGKGRKIVVK